MESVRNTLDRRVQFYEDEIRKLSEQRLMPVWNFCNFFILKVVPFLLYIKEESKSMGCLTVKKQAPTVNPNCRVLFIVYFSEAQISLLEVFMNELFLQLNSVADS